MGWPRYAYPSADKVPADAHHRRTLYSFIKRNAPHPAMATFDMPDRGTSVVRRQTSNTPLQALVLLDDPQYVEAYRALAAQRADDGIGRSGRAGDDHLPARDTPAPSGRRRAGRDCGRITTLQLARYADDDAAASELLTERRHAVSGRRRSVARSRH